MSKPENITHEDIARWEEIMKRDKMLNSLPEKLAQSPILKETCYAGLWMAERLGELNCPTDIIFRIQYHAGKLSFGRNPWEVHQNILDLYKDNKLIFETNLNELSN